MIWLTNSRKKEAHVVLDSHGEENVADVDTGDQSLRLSVGSTHSSLETIGSGTGKHFVDTGDVEGMLADTKMETVLQRTMKMGEMKD